MSGRSLLLTGATSGLGLGLARRVVGRPGWRSILLVRNAERGAVLRQLLGERFTEGFDQIVICEQSSLASVRAAAARVGELVGDGAVEPLSTVVLNAAVLRNDATELSVDGVELTVATNLFGPHTLLAHLSPHLTRDARILIVGSPTIAQTWFQRAAGVKPAAWKPLPEQCEPSDDGVGAYARTKLGLFYLSSAVARLVPAEMSAAYFDPGVMPGTNILRERHRASQLYWLKVLPYIAWTFGGVTVGRGSRVMAPYVLHEKSMGERGFLAVKRRKRPPPVDLTAVAEYFAGADELCDVGENAVAPWWHRREQLTG
jgi:NAD(P)-dependent dehydrogenase (short-subunit alcohol dehydrogenase family)